VWWHKLVVPAVGRLRQEECEFGASLGNSPLSQEVKKEYSISKCMIQDYSVLQLRLDQMKKKIR
jgi:hypothetical protein